MEIPKQALSDASKTLEPRILESLTLAAERIRTFHMHQKHSMDFIDAEGVMLGQKVTPLDRVGVYVPEASLLPFFSIDEQYPCQDSRCEEIVMVTPRHVSDTPRSSGCCSYLWY